MVCLRSADDNSAVVSDGLASSNLMPMKVLPRIGTPSTDLSNLLDVRSNPSQPQGGILATCQGEQNARGGGQILILPSLGEEAGALSSRANCLSISPSNPEDAHGQMMRYLQRLHEPYPRNIIGHNPTTKDKEVTCDNRKRW